MSDERATSHDAPTDPMPTGAEADQPPPEQGGVPGPPVPPWLALGQIALAASGVVLAISVARAGLPDGGEPFGRTAIGAIAAGFSIVCFAVGGALGLSHLVRREREHADPAGAAMIQRLIALSVVHLVVALVAVWPVL